VTAIHAADVGIPGRQQWADETRALRVLIADDDEDIRLLLQQQLADAGMDLKVAAGGRQVLALLRSWTPDVVLLDWLMPGGGLELVRELVTEHGLEGRLIMLSGLDDPRDRQAALAAGATYYLVKPPESEKLIRVIRELAVRTTAS
jgi:CheY-like chemotaxis protein